MRLSWPAFLQALFLLSITSASAQTRAGEPAWRRSLMSLPPQPGGNLMVRDIDRLSENADLARSWFADSRNLRTPADFESNRELVRRMTAWLTAADLMARDPQMRAAVGRAWRAVAALGLLFPEDPGAGPPEDLPAPARGVVVGSPPFAMRAPALGNVPDAEKRTASDLQARYEGAAASAAAAWQNAEVLRQNLAARGMALATATATSVARLQLFFELAADALRNHDWTEAQTNLERAEYETGNVFKAVGR
jgi:hypothetical protein